MMFGMVAFDDCRSFGGAIYMFNSAANLDEIIIDSNRAGTGQYLIFLNTLIFLNFQVATEEVSTHTLLI